MNAFLYTHVDGLDRRLDPTEGGFAHGFRVPCKRDHGPVRGVPGRDVENADPAHGLHPSHDLLDDEWAPTLAEVGNALEETGNGHRGLGRRGTWL